MSLNKRKNARVLHGGVSQTGCRLRSPAAKSSTLKNLAKEVRLRWFHRPSYQSHVLGQFTVRIRFVCGGGIPIDGLGFKVYLFTGFMFVEKCSTFVD